VPKNGEKATDTHLATNRDTPNLKPPGRVSIQDSGFEFRSPIHQDSGFRFRIEDSDSFRIPVPDSGFQYRIPIQDFRNQNSIQNSKAGLLLLTYTD
jgi:hypothetical protein